MCNLAIVRLQNKKHYVIDLIVTILCKHLKVSKSFCMTEKTNSSEPVCSTADAYPLNEMILSKGEISSKVKDS